MSDVFTFNGIGNDAMSLRVMPQTGESLGTPLARVFATAPGMDGAYLQGTSKEPLHFQLPCSLISTSDADAQTKLAALRAWLITDAPCELTFADRPDRVYLALLDGDTQVTRAALTFRTFTLSFVVPNPVAWAADDTTTMLVTSDATGSPFSTIVTNAGGAPTYPRFVLQFSSPATFARVSLGDDYVQVGAAAESGVTPFEARTVLLHDDCSTMTGWGAGTNASGGAVSGTMVTNGTSLSPIHSGGSFGTGAGWHGPTVRKMFGQSAQDFEATVGLRLDDTVPKGSLGGVYTYLIDAAGAAIATMDIRDAWGAVAQNQAAFKIGTKAFATSGPNKATDYTPFSGILKVSRIGTIYKMTVGQGGPSSIGSLSLVKEFSFDAGTASSAPIAGIEIRIASYSTLPVVLTALITQVDFVKLNTPAVIDVPLVAAAGDTLIFDHATNTVFRTVPGSLIPERYMEELDLESDFFPLPAGASTVSIATDGVLALGTGRVALWQGKVTDGDHGGTYTDIVTGQRATVVRNTPATIYDLADGLIHDVAAGLVPLNPWGATQPGGIGFAPVPEAARTNHLINSYGAANDGSKWTTGWTFGGVAGTPTYSIVPGVYGQTALRIQYTGVAGDAGSSLTCVSGPTSVGSFAPGGDTFASVWVKGSLTGCIFKVAANAMTSAGAYIAAASGVRTVSASWTRATLLYPNLPANTSRMLENLFIAEIHPGDTIDITLCAAQLEAGAFPTSYIPTTTGAANRAACAVTVPTAGWNPAAGTIVVVMADPPAACEAVYAAADANNYLILRRETGSYLDANLLIKGAGLLVIATRSKAAAGAAVLAGTWVGGAPAYAYVDGVQGAATANCTALASLPATAFIGSSGGAQLFANTAIAAIVVYNHVLSATEVAALNGIVTGVIPGSETHRDCW